MSNLIEKLSRVLARYLKISSDELNSSFRPAKIDEIPQVSQIRLGSKDKQHIDEDVAYLYWRYFSRSPELSDLWVLVLKERVIAAVGMERLKIGSAKGEISAVRLGDIIVDNKFKNLGIGGWITLKLQCLFSSIIAIGPNENSKSISDRLLTFLPILKHYKMLLNGKGYFEKYVSNQALLKLLSVFFDVFFSNYLKFKIKYQGSIPGACFRTFNNVQDFLAHIPDRERSLFDSHSGSLTRVVRDLEFLKWRYESNPRNQFGVIGLFDGKDVLKGYVIYVIKEVSYDDDFHYALNEGFVVDWEYDGSSGMTDVFTALFLRAIKELQKQGADRVNLLAADRESTKAATNAGFILRGLDSRFYVYQSGEKGILYEADKWIVSYSDFDEIDLLDR